MSQPNEQIKNKELLSQWQSRFLLLFLKYKLAFRYEWEQDTASSFPQGFHLNKLMAHCWFHAVFSNRTKDEPAVWVKISSAQEILRLEIKSTGAADSFFAPIDAYCQDDFFKGLFKYCSPYPEGYTGSLPEAVCIDTTNNGSIIQYMLK